MLTLRFLIMGFIGLAALVQPFEGEARPQKVPVSEDLKAELNEILANANQLHGAMFEKNQQQVATLIQEISATVQTVQSKLGGSSGSATLLEKTFNALGRNIEEVKFSSGDERLEKLKLVFKHLVDIAKTYDVKSYKIFFCHKNKAVWLQTSWKAKNPFGPDALGSCGKYVR